MGGGGGGISFGSGIGGPSYCIGAGGGSICGASSLTNCGWGGTGCCGAGCCLGFGGGIRIKPSIACGGSFSFISSA